MARASRIITTHEWKAFTRQEIQTNHKGQTQTTSNHERKKLLRDMPHIKIKTNQATTRIKGKY